MVTLGAVSQRFKLTITGEPTRKKPLGRLRRRLEDNIRIDFKEIWINRRNWVDSVQYRDYWRALVNAASKPPGSISHGVRYN